MSKYLTGEKMTAAGQNLAAELYNPSVASFHSWLANGTADAYGRYGKAPQRVVDAAALDRDLRDDIALDLFVKTLPNFLRRLDNGEHDPRRSSIQTFFIGDCRNRLNGLLWSYDARVRESRQDTSDLLAYLQSETAPQLDTGYSTIEDYDVARKVLLEAPDGLRAALLIQIYEDVTPAEAARRIGSNPATIRSQLLRYKKALINDHFAGDIYIPEDTALGQWIKNVEERRARRQKAVA